MDLIQALRTSMFCPSEPVGVNLIPYKGRLGLPVLMLGPPGIGKTTIWRDVAASLDLPCYVFPTESLQVSDLAGVIAGDGAGGVHRVSDNEAVQYIFGEGQGLLVFDEINTGSRLDGAIRRVLLDGKFAGASMPPRVRVVACANPPEISMSGRPLTPPLANSLVHLTAREHTAEEWVRYHMDPATARAPASGQQLWTRLLDAWSTSYETALGWYSLFFKAHPSWMHKLPEDPDKQAGAWPSERTHTMGLNVLAACHALGDKASLPTLLEGCIGQEAAGLFLTTMRENDLPSVEDVLSGKWVPDPKRTDIMYSVTQSLVARLSHQLQVDNPRRGPPVSQQLQLARQAWEYVHKVNQGNSTLQDLVLPVAKTLLQGGYASALRMTAKGPDVDAIERISKEALLAYPTLVYGGPK